MKTDGTQMGYESVDWIILAQDRVQRLALVNAGYIKERNLFLE
jgi:hypothetical protein